MSSTPLLDWTPPDPPKFFGATFNHDRDFERLSGLLQRVAKCMADGKERGLRDIAEAVGGMEASVSARLRDLRREGFNITKRNAGGGLWLYRMVR